MAINFSSLGGGGGATPKVQKFNSTQSWTAPDGVTTLEIEGIGGGGGGGNYAGGVGGGGGAGGYLRDVITVVPGTTYTVTIGAGGSGAGTGTVEGGSGTASTFGALFTAPGGGGGAGSSFEGGINSEGCVGGGRQTTNRYGGGGAGIAGTFSGFSGTQPFYSQSPNVGFGKFGWPAFMGQTSQAYATWFGGAGKDGFGGGGSGGGGLNYGAPHISNNGGGGGANPGFAATAGGSNTGGGGGGGCDYASRNAENGGSGFITIRWVE